MQAKLPLNAINLYGGQCCEMYFVLKRFCLPCILFRTAFDDVWYLLLFIMFNYIYFFQYDENSNFTHCVGEG